MPSFATCRGIYEGSQVRGQVFSGAARLPNSPFSFQGAAAVSRCRGARARWLPPPPFPHHQSGPGIIRAPLSHLMRLVCFAPPSGAHNHSDLLLLCLSSASLVWRHSKPLSLTGEGDTSLVRKFESHRTHASTRARARARDKGGGAQDNKWGLSPVHTSSGRGHQRKWAERKRRL